MDSRLLTGTLEMLVLEVVSAGPTYGYAISQEVTGRSNGLFELKEGSLYPALHRLARRKLLSANWREADGRRRKYYRITVAGTKALAERKREWHQFAAGVRGVVGDAGGLA